MVSSFSWLADSIHPNNYLKESSQGWMESADQLKHDTMPRSTAPIVFPPYHMHRVPGRRPCGEVNDKTLLLVKEYNDWFIWLRRFPAPCASARSAYKARERESSAVLCRSTYLLRHVQTREGELTCVARCLYLKFPHGNLNSQVLFARNLSTIQYNMYILNTPPYIYIVLF